MVSRWSVTGSAVSLRGSFFESSALETVGVNCSGSEMSLFSCTVKKSSCHSSELAGVACPGMLVLVECVGCWCLWSV